MNILYISALNGLEQAGPTYSVPNQIKAQAKYDNVFWYNLTSLDKGKRDRFSKYYEFNDINDYPNGKISDLPKPFNNPDIIIFEQFYVFKLHKIIREAIKRNIPYIFIPRSEFTKRAQARKFLKKKIANILYFYKIANKATAIQYLTKEEKINSGEKWNSKGIIIPNGVGISGKLRRKEKKENINVTYIGRIEPYQKGLDLLIKACSKVKSKLIENNVKINIYGTNKENKRQLLENNVKEDDLTEVISFHEAVFGKDKEAVLLDTDIFLMTSRFEGHPMALIEALSYGIPCFVTKGTNMLEEISENDAGWVSQTQVGSISDALNKMVDEINKIDKKGENALNLAKKYDWDYLAKKAHDEYIKIV